MQYNRTIIVEANSINKTNNAMTSNDFTVKTPSINIPKGSTIELDGCIVEEASAGNDSIIELSNQNISNQKNYNSSFQLLEIRYYLNNNGLNSICQPYIQNNVVLIDGDTQPIPRWGAITKYPNTSTFVNNYVGPSIRIDLLSGPYPSTLNTSDPPNPAIGISNYNDWNLLGTGCLAYENPIFMKWDPNYANGGGANNGNWIFEDAGGSKIKVDSTTVNWNVINADSTIPAAPTNYPNGSGLYGIAGLKSALRKNQPDSSKFTYMKPGYKGPNVRDDSDENRGPNFDWINDDATYDLEIFTKQIPINLSESLLETPDQIAIIVNGQLQNSSLNKINKQVPVMGELGQWSYEYGTEDLYLRAEKLPIFNISSDTLINIPANFQNSEESTIYGDGFFVKDAERWVGGNAFLKTCNHRSSLGLGNREGMSVHSYENIFALDNDFETIYNNATGPNASDFTKLFPNTTAISCTIDEFYFYPVTDNDQVDYNFSGIIPADWNPDLAIKPFFTTTNTDGTLISSTQGVPAAAPGRQAGDNFFAVYFHPGGVFGGTVYTNKYYFVNYETIVKNWYNGRLTLTLTEATDNGAKYDTVADPKKYYINVGIQDVINNKLSGGNPVGRMVIKDITDDEMFVVLECRDPATANLKEFVYRDDFKINGLPYISLSTSIGGGALAYDSVANDAILLENPIPAPLVQLSYVGAEVYHFVGTGGLDSTTVQFTTAGDGAVFVGSTNHLFNTLYYRNIICITFPTATPPSTPLPEQYYIQVVSFRAANPADLASWDNIIAQGANGWAVINGQVYNVPPAGYGTAFISGGAFSRLAVSGADIGNQVVNGSIRPRYGLFTNAAGYSWNFDVGSGGGTGGEPGNAKVDEYLAIPRGYIIPMNVQPLAIDYLSVLKRIQTFFRKNEKYCGTKTTYAEQRADKGNWYVELDPGFADDFNNAYSNWLSSDFVDPVVGAQGVKYSIYGEEQNYSKVLPYYSNIMSMEQYGFGDENTGLGTTGTPVQRPPLFGGTRRGFNFIRPLTIYPISRYAQMGCTKTTRENYIRVYSRYCPEVWNYDLNVGNAAIWDRYAMGQPDNAGHETQMSLPMYSINEDGNNDIRQAMIDMDIGCLLLEFIQNGFDIAGDANLANVVNTVGFINFIDTFGGTGLDEVLYDIDSVEDSMSGASPKNFRQSFRILSGCPLGFDPASTTNPFSNSVNINQSCTTNQVATVQEFYNKLQVGTVGAGNYAGNTGVGYFSGFFETSTPVAPATKGEVDYDANSPRIEDYINNIWIGSTNPVLQFNNSRMEFANFFTPRQFNSLDSVGDDPNIGAKIAFFNDDSYLFSMLNNNYGNIPATYPGDGSVIPNAQDQVGTFIPIRNKGICDELTGIGINNLYVRGEFSTAVTSSGAGMLKCILKDDGTTENYEGCLFELFGFDLSQFKPRYGTSYNRYEISTYNEIGNQRYEGLNFFALNSLIGQNACQIVNIFGPNYNSTVPSGALDVRPPALRGKPAYLQGYVGFQPTTIQVQTAVLRSDNLPSKLQNAFYMIFTNLPNSRYVTNNSEMNVIGYFYRQYKSGNFYFSYPTSYTKTLTEEFNLTNIRIAILNQNGRPAENLGKKVSAFFKIVIPTTLPAPDKEEAIEYVEDIENPERDQLEFDGPDALDPFQEEFVLGGALLPNVAPVAIPYNINQPPPPPPPPPPMGVAAFIPVVPPVAPPAAFQPVPRGQFMPPPPAGIAPPLRGHAYNPANDIEPLYNPLNLARIGRETRARKRAGRIAAGAETKTDEQRSRNVRRRRARSPGRGTIADLPAPTAEERARGRQQEEIDRRARRSRSQPPPRARMARSRSSSGER